MPQLATLADVKAFLHIPDGTKEHDRALSAWIDAASEAVERWCQQPLLATARTIVASGLGGIVWGLGYHPVGVSSVARRSGYGSGAVWTTLAGTDYEVQGSMIIIPSGFTEGTMNWKAVCTVGPAAVDPDVRQVVIDLVATRYRESGIKGGQQRPGAAGKASPPSVTSNTSLSEQHQRLLAPHMLLHI